MNITVFGANGRVGSLVVAELLKRGHEVTAFVHGDSQLGNHPKLKIVQGDVYDESSVSEALGSTDVVVSALGSWGTKRKDILTEGMKRIIPVAEALGIKRLVSLTGADARAPGEHLSLLQRITRGLFGIIADKILQDGEHHMQLLAESSLDWVVVRSPVMKDAGASAYTLDSKHPQPWHTIPRTAVVQAMCDLVETSDHSTSAPFIRRG